MIWRELSLTFLAIWAEAVIIVGLVVWIAIDKIHVGDNTTHIGDIHNHYYRSAEEAPAPKPSIFWKLLGFCTVTAIVCLFVFPGSARGVDSSGQDSGLLYIYDARVDGGFPEPPPPPLGCEGESCQNPNPAPEHTTPSSLLSDGPGNLSEKPPKKACPKGKVKKGGKCVKKKGKKKGKGAKNKHRQAQGARR